MLIRGYDKSDCDAVARIHDAARLDELRDSAGVDAFLTPAPHGRALLRHALAHTGDRAHHGTPRRLTRSTPVGTITAWSRRAPEWCTASLTRRDDDSGALVAVPGRGDLGATTRDTGRPAVPGLARCP
ncbi:hypothetical protein [Actinoplanes nipponensis]|uniref:hypothetical protein n=1 Tax=Actinoplanes nipponensis TaxID=135950 RepID=UPI001942D93B|nr:hypothetical protein [Actinoplanes nipponensis]